MQHASTDRLEQAHLALNRKAATGVYGQTWEAYGVHRSMPVPEIEKLTPEIAPIDRRGLGRPEDSEGAVIFLIGDIRDGAFAAVLW